MIKVSRSDTFIRKRWSLWPVSLLSHISKFYERVIYNQINEYIEPFLSKVLTGFRKNHNTQHSLLKMLENFNKALDKSNSVSAIFVDLFKAFDTLNHDLLIAKLEAYGFLQSFFSTCTAIDSYQMSILIFIFGKKFSQEFFKNLFLVHVYSILILMVFFVLLMRHF